MGYMRKGGEVEVRAGLGAIGSGLLVVAMFYVLMKI